MHFATVTMFRLWQPLLDIPSDGTPQTNEIQIMSGGPDLNQQRWPDNFWLYE